MIILLQSVTTQSHRLFWQILYCKVQQSNYITKRDRLLLQSTSGITKCDRLLLQSVSGIKKCGRLYCKVRQLLQSVTVITKWERQQLEHSYRAALEKIQKSLKIPVNKKKEFLLTYFLKIFFQILSNLLLLPFQIPRAPIFDNTFQRMLL